MELLQAPLRLPLRILGFANLEPSTISHLQSLGVYPGGTITLVEVALGAAVCRVKDSRLAFDHDVSRNILVEVAQ